MTSAQGSGVRRKPEALGERVPSLRFSSAALHRVPAELVAQRGVHLRRERLVLPRGEPREQRHRDRRRRDALVDRAEHRPAALAGVLDVAADLLEARILARARARAGRAASCGRPSRAARAPRPCRRSSSNSEALHDLEALGERLHHPVLDPVVDHLHEVARARRADVRVAARLGQVLEERLDRACTRLASPPTITQ